MKCFLGLIVALVISLVLIGAGPKSFTRVYVFSYLVLDEPDGLSEDEMSAAMAGHFRNMDVLAEEGKLLIAGPLAEPRISELYRGIYVFDVDTVDKGMELFRTDPSVQARVFKPEMYLIECADPLLELPRLEKEDEAKRLVDPDISDAWEGRAYVLAIASEDAGFDRDDAVLIDAVMTPIDDDKLESSRLLFLDFETVDQAREHFKAEDVDEWAFYGWYGSKMVAEMQAQ